MVTKLELAVSLEFTGAFYQFIPIEKLEFFRYRQAG